MFWGNAWKKRGVLFAGAAFLLAACSENNADSNASSDEGVSDDVAEWVQENDEELPKSLDDVIESSEMIVKAEFKEESEIINGNRDTRDYSQPSDDLYSKAHVNLYEISEVYAGDFDEPEVNILQISEYHHPIRNDSGETVDEVVVPNVDYEEPEHDKEYIFFLRETDIGEAIGEELYAAASNVSQIAIEEDGEIRFISGRMEGQINEQEVTVEDDQVAALTEHRGDEDVNYTQYLGIIDDLLEGYDLDSLEDKLEEAE